MICSKKQKNVSKKLCIFVNNYYQTEFHPTCADCLYNLSIIYKKKGMMSNAHNSIVECIKIRIDTIGKESIPTANAYEQYAKLNFKLEKYEQAIKSLENCYSIHKKLYPEGSNHPDLQRVSRMATYFYNVIDKISRETNVPQKPKVLDLTTNNDDIHKDTKLLDFEKLVRETLARRDEQAEIEKQQQEVNYFILFPHLFYIGRC